MTHMQSNRWAAFSATALFLFMAAAVVMGQWVTANTIIRVTVLDPSGEPIEHAPVSVFSPQGRRFGYTDAAGVTEQTLDRIVGLPVHAGVAHSDFGIEPPGGYQLARDRFVALRDQFSVPYPKPLLIAGEGVGPFQSTIQLRTRQVVRGVVHDAAGNPVNEGHVFVWQYFTDDLTDAETGVFELTNAPQGQDLILVMDDERPSISVHEIALSDIVDGTIASPLVRNVPTQEDAEFRMKAEGISLVHSIQGCPLGLGVALVHISGEYIRSYDTFPLDETIVDQSNPAEDNMFRPQAPAGEYLVVPGLFFHDLPIAVVRGIRAGRLDALKAAGVPSITLQPGLNEPFTFNAKNAHDAAMTVIADLLPALPGS